MTTSFKELFSEAVQHTEYWVADAQYDLAEQIHTISESNNISRLELAKNIGISLEQLTNVMRGEIDLTITELVKIARGLGDFKIEINIIPIKDKQ